MGDSKRILGRISTKSPLARLPATQGMRASATPWPVSAACVISLAQLK